MTFEFDKKDRNNLVNIIQAAVITQLAATTPTDYKVLSTIDLLNKWFSHLYQDEVEIKIVKRKSPNNDFNPQFKDALFLEMISTREQSMKEINASRPENEQISYYLMVERLLQDIEEIIDAKDNFESRTDIGKNDFIAQFEFQSHLTSDSTEPQHNQFGTIGLRSYTANAHSIRIFGANGLLFETEEGNNFTVHYEVKGAEVFNSLETHLSNYKHLVKGV